MCSVPLKNWQDLRGCIPNQKTCTVPSLTFKVNFKEGRIHAEDYCQAQDTAMRIEETLSSASTSFLSGELNCFTFVLVM